MGGGGGEVGEAEKGLRWWGGVGWGECISEKVPSPLSSTVVVLFR